LLSVRDVIGLSPLELIRICEDYNYWQLAGKNHEQY
jgi:hypothetical protein